MVKVEAGEFIMGSDKGDDDEKPIHRVYLGEFMMVIIIKIVQKKILWDLRPTPTTCCGAAVGSTARPTVGLRIAATNAPASGFGVVCQGVF
jgi:hypothetical protein